MSTFGHIDKDGDRLHAAMVTTNPPFVAYLQVYNADSDESAAVGLTADAARDLAAKLTKWAGEEEPAPAFKVGDRVSPSGRGYGDWEGAAARVLVPDYAAMAAEFKPGDLAIVGDNPGTDAEPGNGYVAPEYAGAAVTVVTVYGELVTVRNHSHHCAQDVHVAHLTKAKAVPA